MVKYRTLQISLKLRKYILFPNSVVVQSLVFANSLLFYFRTFECANVESYINYQKLELNYSSIFSLYTNKPVFFGSVVVVVVVDECHYTQHEWASREQYQLAHGGQCSTLGSPSATTAAATTTATTAAVLLIQWQNNFDSTAAGRHATQRPTAASISAAFHSALRTTAAIECNKCQWWQLASGVHPKATGATFSQRFFVEYDVRGTQWWQQGVDATFA